MFRVGDLVRLSKRGRKIYRDEVNNPWHEVGVISVSNLLPKWEEIHRPPVLYCVRWQEAKNYYREVDLELVGPPISLEEMLKECLE